MSDGQVPRDWWLEDWEKQVILEQREQKLEEDRTRRQQNRAAAKAVA